MTLTTAEIASMRAELTLTHLDMTCDVLGYTPGAEDTHGHGAPGVWAVELNNIACHYWEEDEAELVGQPNAVITRERVLLEANVDVHAGDRIGNVVGVDGAELVSSLEILEVLKREFDTLLIVRAVR